MGSEVFCFQVNIRQFHNCPALIFFLFNHIEFGKLAGEIIQVKIFIVSESLYALKFGRQVF